MGFFVSIDCDSIEDYSRGGVSSDFSDFSDFSVSSEERKTGGLHILVPTTQATLGSPASYRYIAMILGFWMHYLPRSVGGNRLQQLRIGARPSLEALYASPHSRIISYRRHQSDLLPTSYLTYVRYAVQRRRHSSWSQTPVHETFAIRRLYSSKVGGV